MISTSPEFDDALEAEVERHVKERIDLILESQELYDRVAKELLSELAEYPLVASSEEGASLRIHLGSTDHDYFMFVDVEKAVEAEIYNGDADHLKHILSRLEFLASKVRSKLSNKAI